MLDGRSGERSARVFEPDSLDDYMSKDQQKILVDALRRVTDNAYGEIRIQIEHGIVRTLIVSESILMNRPL